MNYIAAAGRVNSPNIGFSLNRNVRPAAQNVSQNIPTTGTDKGAGNLFINLDGDRAEISDRARGLSFLSPNQRPVGPGLLANFRFNLPDPLFGMDNSGLNPMAAPSSANQPGALLSPGTSGDNLQGPMLPESANNAMMEALEPSGSCYTCDNRKYVDQSDDASVSFQTPTNISPSMAAAAVASHENEHVRNEQARAQRDDREIVSQTVTLQYDTCPECGKQYVSGGRTRTTSVSKSDSENGFEMEASSEGDAQE